MKTLMYMEGLNSEDTLKRITLKLPSSVGVRWCHLANKMLKSEERLSMFHDVVKFVTQEASLATDPVFSPEALKEARKNEFTNTTNSSNSGRRVKSVSSFSTAVAAVQVPVMLLKPPIPSQILCLLQFEYTSMTTPNDDR